MNSPCDNREVMHQVTNVGALSASTESSHNDGVVTSCFQHAAVRLLCARVDVRRHVFRSTSAKHVHHLNIFRGCKFTFERDVTAKQLECEKETCLLGVDGERMHRIDGKKSRGGVRLDQVGCVSLTQSVKDARLVDETQRREILCAIELRRVRLKRHDISNLVK